MNHKVFIRPLNTEEYLWKTWKIIVNSLKDKTMSKGRTINGIKSVIEKWGGSITTKEMECETSFKLDHISDKHFSLIERFYREDVEVITYIDGEEKDVFNVPYTNLSFDLLDEILNELETYDIMMDKTMDSCRDEDWN